jgi:hypothetical protein
MKELRFSHITKTAGTSIEDAALASGIQWGRHHLTGKHYWHDPISTFPSELREPYDWFIVVRNPYERILSEYHCPWMATYRASHTVKDLNRIICDYIAQRLTFPRHGGGGHYMEQWRYLDPSVTVHVLKMETLGTDFGALMKQYDLTVTLDVKNKGHPKKFGISDLYPETIRVINEVYAKDFELFGYTPI